MLPKRSRIVATVLATAAVCLGTGGTVAAQAEKAEKAPAIRALGSEFQLVVDDVLLASKAGVVRKIHPCQKLPQPVLASQEPWEQDGFDQRIYVYGTVLRDGPDGPFRMWYNRNSLVLYATSRDGLLWERPRLELCEYLGSKRNNLVLPLFHSPSVVYNPRAESPDQRYVMLGCGRANGPGYYAAHSADGLHWSLYPRNPVLTSSDTCTLALDPATGEYLAFHKRTHKHRGQPRRLVYLAVSRDMQQWSQPAMVMAPDEIDDAQVRAEGGRFAQFYNMSAFPYGGQFLGLVTHFRYTGPPPKQGPLQSGDDGPVDVQLVHSRDGRSWSRCEDRSPVIPNGPHAYDAGCILGVANGPVTAGQELWLYYTAITTTHGGFVPEKKITIGLAKWRRDGFVSLDAGPAGGVIETVPLHCDGNRLVVNADAGAGELTAAVLDERGRELPGYGQADCLPLRADAVRHTIRWKDRERLDTEGPLRLRFYLTNARLFSYAVVAR
ncbi:MAG: glycoside hydrolase family 43 protein [Candidatus Anammoximicrobium sp.]|nr:glycoside hydrolase family 43 protein [Candidatus Anammoximicrobium sp.]